MKKFMSFIFCIIFTTSLCLGQGAISASGYENENMENKEVENKDIENKDIENKDIENKKIEDKGIENKNIVNDITEKADIKEAVDIIVKEESRVQAAMLAPAVPANTFEVSLSVDSSYEIVNNTEKNFNITNTSKRIDGEYNIISHNWDGSIRYSRVGRYGGIDLAKGTRVKISSRSKNEVKLYIPNELKGSTSEISGPVFNKLTMENGKNYEFYNSSNKIMQLLTTASNLGNNKDRYDMIQYNTNGDIYSAENDKYGEVKLNVGHKMRINLSRGNIVEVYIPYEYKDMYKEVKESAFHKVTMENGKSYEFKNSYDKKIQLLTTASNLSNNKDRYDVIQYDSNGDIYSAENDKYGEINLNVGDKMRVNLSKGNSVELYIPYEYKDMYKEVKESAFHKVTMESGKSYEFKNSFEKKIQLITTASNLSNNKDRYDVIQYNSNGDIYSVENDKYGEVNLNVGHSMRVNLSKGNSVELYIPYEYKDMYKEVKEPVFYKAIIKNEKNCEIYNSSNKKIKVLTTASLYTNGNKYDMVKYNSSGDIYSNNKNEYKDIDLNAGDKIRMNIAIGDSIEVDIPYEYKDMYKEVKEPAFYKLAMEKGKNYEFKNSFGEKMQLLTSIDSSSDGNKYDMVKYNSSGDIYSNNKNEYKAIDLNSGDKIRINVSIGNNIKVYIPYEYKDMYKEVKEPAFHELTMEKGKNYEFNNSSNKNIEVLTSAGSSNNEGKYDLLKFDSSGNIKSNFKNEYRDIGVNVGEKIRINIAIGEHIKLYVPYEYKDMYKEVKEPVFHELTIEKGKNYEFNNSYSKEIELITSANNSSSENRYDIIKYNKSGERYSGYNNNYGSIDLNSGDKMRINLSNGNNIKVYIPYEYKDMYKEVKEPVFYVLNIKPGKSFIFKNNLNTRTQIFSNANHYGGRYNFDMYSSDGTSTAEVKNSSGSISLGAGEIVDIKLSMGAEFSFYLPYEIMNGIVEKGDINNDKVIDVLDLAQVAVKYNEKSNIQKYNKHDINRDGIVDIYDIVLIAKKCA
ncbi:dockerin type I domain-containing protein [Clostridium gasigenes]|uniref:Dockerin domain-containing protein n=1 Tax=Clostridium gasigenes TaxID=94869 RepID=A0A1H0W2S1_9CLOT|nr:dockerin type I domain-containing protein [Clostridium gasigenes]SDP85040.1 hypothetical protein SAMN04488529_1294 [Clostridium gasigenes]